MDLPGLERVDNTASVVREGRARIMWGDAIPAVQTWMVEEGVDEQFADEVIRAAMKERGIEVRKQGMKDFVLGAVILTVSIALLILVLVSAMVSMPLIGGCFAGGAYGAFLFFRGLGRLIAGGRASVDVSDL